MADEKFSMLKEGIKKDAISKHMVFMIMLKRPKVNMIKGNAKIFRIGLIKEFTMPKIAPIMNKFNTLPSTLIPLIK